jgi:hypothetical protein
MFVTQLNHTIKIFHLSAETAYRLTAVIRIFMEWIGRIKKKKILK